MKIPFCCVIKMMQKNTRFFLIAFVLGVLACEAPPAQEMAFDAGVDCAENLPPPSIPCLPRCGNELGVGQPCTKGGGECSDFSFSEAPLCTVDFDDTDMAFCTRACVSDDQCGTGAYCAIDPDNPTSGAGCTPLSCKDDDDEEPVLDGGSNG